MIRLKSEQLFFLSVYVQRVIDECMWACRDRQGERIPSSLEHLHQGHQTCEAKFVLWIAHIKWFRLEIKFSLRLLHTVRSVLRQYKRPVMHPATSTYPELTSLDELRAMRDRVIPFRQSFDLPSVQIVSRFKFFTS